ncbi:hypothetical protein HBH82_069530 [Parastagonospora nodorum]|nr:hypothetical protein HBH82_069530 [Parastagonospora nodorum]KAH4711550.1 hypothetical protein HBH67_021170 [Parastagonospora nodorum]KAH4718803.1 hypothetical protein HBH78_025180 [Parastagonospora nodorum]KAH4785731.1 hypothetical protein HBH62_082170 [Parastagonospora nodorum]KAH4824687.1 hypothetical protein HBH63_043540 [Parastagonospora nodorum]
MAYNSWDKLAKAQRDYPKPKFANQVVDKALKKQSNNPYLLTWKADILLQPNHDRPKETLAFVQRAHQQPIMDTELLAYMYETFIAASRLETEDHHIATMGTEAFATWQATASRMKHKSERASLWDLLFSTAIQEDCWEDVRLAIVKYSRENPSDKKQCHYSQIIAGQLAAKQRFLSGGAKDMHGEIKKQVAKKLMLEAYQAPSEDAIAVNTIRELRFMGETLGGQGFLKELQEAWSNPSPAQKVLFDRHRSDITALMTKLLQEHKEWKQLEKHCVEAIDEIRLNLHASKSKFWELCAWRWDLWGAMVNAVYATRSEEDAQKFIANKITECFPDGVESKDRPLRLTYLMLRDQIGTSMLDDCKRYYQDFSSTPSCFNDLRPKICRLPREELKEFQRFMGEQVDKNLAEAESCGEGHEATLDIWRRRHLVWLKFEYLFAVMLREYAGTYLYYVLQLAIRASKMWPEDPEFSCLVTYTLLNMHQIHVRAEDKTSELEDHVNPRILLQATIFARHQVEMDKDKQNRTFSLLAARLHLNLGFGTVAFKLYTHATCKEMLLDTLSPFMLSRISHTHPFEVKGYGGFSADAELAKVIATIERMEKKTNSYLVTDISSFRWDQVIDTIGLRRKLNSSLTKHLCVAERRKMARLRGDSVEDLPRLPFKAYTEISDNIDFEVFPDFEDPSQPDRLVDLIVPNHIPTLQWIYDCNFNREKACQLLHQEATVDDFDPIDTIRNEGDVGGGIRDGVFAETFTQEIWAFITKLAFAVHLPELHAKDVPFCLSLSARLKSARKGCEKIRMPGDTTLDPVDEPGLCHENMLMLCYSFLEVCRANHKLTELLKDKVVKSKGKPHPLKQIIPAKFVDELAEEGAILFAAIRDIATSYIALLKSRGIKAIKAQVRWGTSGEALKLILSDDDVEYYAKEYVDSALEAWGGVLKVKLK